MTTSTFIRAMYSKHHKYRFCSVHETIQKTLLHYDAYPQQNVRAAEFAFEHLFKQLNLPSLIQSEGAPEWGSLRFPWLVITPTIATWAYPIILLQYVFQHVRG